MSDAPSWHLSGPAKDFKPSIGLDSRLSLAKAQSFRGAKGDKGPCGRVSGLWRLFAS